MPHRWNGVPFRAAVLSVAVAVGAPSQRALAQERVVVHGVVRDSTGAPVPSADVSIVDLHLLARSDDRGIFHLLGLRPGEHNVGVRRIGYEPRTVTLVASAESDTLVVVLRARPEMLPGMTVSERDMRRRLSIEDFYRRRAKGPGVFVTRDEIEARHAGRPSDALRSVPGLQFIRSRAGSGVRFVASAIQRRDCVPQIWLDGARIDGVEIDELPVMDIEGIELYAGPSTTPLQFSQGAITSCGTIVIWSRVPGT